MNRYFKHFPLINYPTDITNPDGSAVSIVDLTARFRISHTVLNNPHAYYYYAWKDGDRPDTVANDYYEDPNLAWLVMLSAEAFDSTYDFPMDTNTFNKYLISKYNTPIEELLNFTHHYEDKAGFTIDFKTYNEIGGRIVSIYEYEDELNESRRVIKLISKEYVPQIVKELREGMRAIDKSNKEVRRYE